MLISAIRFSINSFHAQLKIEKERYKSKRSVLNFSGDFVYCTELFQRLFP